LEGSYARAKDGETQAESAASAVKRAGFAGITAANPEIAALLAEGASVQLLADVARETAAKGKPWGYVVGTVRGRLRDARSGGGIDAKASPRPAATASPERPREDAAKADAAFRAHVARLKGDAKKQQTADDGTQAATA